MSTDEKKYPFQEGEPAHHSQIDLSNSFPLGGTGYMPERIPPKGFGGAVADPHALANTLLQHYQYPPSDRLVTVKAHPGINVGEPAPSLAMEATIDGHTYKGMLYLASDEQEQEEPQKPAKKIIAIVNSVSQGMSTVFPARAYWEVNYTFNGCRYLLNWKDEWGAHPLNGNTIEIEYDEPGVIAHARVLHGGL